MTLRTNRFLPALVTLVLLSVPALALASSTVSPVGFNSWTLYTFANGSVIWNILNSIAAMVHDTQYLHLLQFVALLGILALGIVAGMAPAKAPRLLFYFVAVYGVLYASLALNARIDVVDTVTGYNNVATNVPAALGIPAAVISDVGEWMTAKIEQDFSLPTQLTTTGGGAFDMAPALVSDAMRVRITDPYLQQSIAMYTQNCVVPSLANGTLDPSTLLNAPDFWSAAYVSNQGLTTLYYNHVFKGGVAVSCPSAWNSIGSDLSSESPQLLQSAAGAWYSTSAVSWVGAAMGSALTWVSNNMYNGSAASAVEQSAAIHAFQGSFRQAALATNNNPLLMNISIAQAEKSQTNSWYTASQIFRDLVGYIYSILQAFIFASVPILLVAALIPGFGAILAKNYLQILLWMILWQPLLAIVNYIIALYAQAGISGLFGPSGGGITMHNLPVITVQTARFETAAGFMASMVPLIAWGLVKGSIAFTDFILGAAGSAYAGSAAQMMATGNVTLASETIGNETLQQFNLARKSSVGYMQTASYIGGASVLYDEQMGGGMLDLNGAAVNETRQTAISESASQSLARTAALSQQFSRATSAMQGEMAQFARDYGLGEGWTHGGGSQVQPGTSGRVDSGAGASQSGGAQHEVGTKGMHSTSAGVETKGGIGVPLPGGSLGATATSKSQNAAELTAAQRREAAKKAQAEAGAKEEQTFSELKNEFRRLEASFKTSRHNMTTQQYQAGVARLNSISASFSTLATLQQKTEESQSYTVSARVNPLDNGTSAFVDGYVAAPAAAMTRLMQSGGPAIGTGAAAESAAWRTITGDGVHLRAAQHQMALVAGGKALAVRTRETAAEARLRNERRAAQKKALNQEAGTQQNVQDQENFDRALNDAWRAEAERGEGKVFPVIKSNADAGVLGAAESAIDSEWKSVRDHDIKPNL